MNIDELSKKLIEYCKSNEFEKAQKELYATDAVSIEPDESAGFDKETNGLKAIQEKIQKFMAGIEESYGTSVSEPTVAGNSFSFKLDMDIKMKGQDRMTMSEICVYTVKDGKIILEQFFW